MKKMLNRTLLTSTLLCLVPVVFALIVYERLPEQIATNFGINGAPNSYSSRFFGAIGLPLLLAGFNIILHIGLDSDPSRRAGREMLVLVGKWIIPVISIVVNSAVLLFALGYPIRMDRLCIILISLILTIVGNYLPKCRQNYTAGIRLPWTLYSEENWNRTHRLAGFIWTAGGLLMLFSGLLGNNWLFAGILLAMILIPAVYSFLLYRRGI